MLLLPNILSAKTSSCERIVQHVFLFLKRVVRLQIRASVITVGNSLLLAIILSAPIKGQMQFTPQWPHEMLWEEWKATEIPYDKAPMDGYLPLSPFDDILPDSYAVFVDTATTIPAPVSSDEPLHVRLVQATSTPRILTSFSPGLNIGRGVWSWRATACNVTDQSQAVDSGDIEAAANSTGIPTIGYGEAQVSNQLYINRSKPVVGSQLAMGATGLGTVLIASKIIAASGVWGAALGAATYAADRLITYFKSVTPADLTVRFSGTAILQDNGSTILPPRSLQHHCATWEFFARNSGKNAVARAGVPIY